MDEPQQQSVDDANFLRMLRYAAKLQSVQIIVATSHERVGIGKLANEVGITELWELGDERLITRNG